MSSENVRRQSKSNFYFFALIDYRYCCTHTECPAFVSLVWIEFTIIIIIIFFIFYWGNNDAIFWRRHASMCALYIVYKLSTRHCRRAVGYLVHTNRSCLRIVYIVQYWTCHERAENGRDATPISSISYATSRFCIGQSMCRWSATSNFQLLHVISTLFTLYMRVWYVPSREANVYEGSRDHADSTVSTSMDVPLLNITAVCCGYFLLER